MESQNNTNQVQQNIPESQVPVTVPSAEPVKPSSNSFLVSLLSVLLLLAVIAAGFFAYQTQRLVKELRIKNEELSQPTSNPVPTYEPGLEPEPIPTEISTKDWKIYTNEKYGFEFKYPNELLMKSSLTDEASLFSSVRNVYLLSPQYPDYDNRIIDIENHDLLVPPIGWQEIEVVVNGYNAKKYVLIGGDASVKFDIYQIKSVTGGVEIMVNKQMPELVDQILSTFKFTD
jgi:hypothetical protein